VPPPAAPAETQALSTALLHPESGGGAVCLSVSLSVRRQLLHAGLWHDFVASIQDRTTHCCALSSPHLSISPCNFRAAPMLLRPLCELWAGLQGVQALAVKLRCCPHYRPRTAVNGRARQLGWECSS
jgi:hypothetical protein